MKLALLYVILVGLYSTGFAQKGKQLAQVCLDGKYGFIDPSGREVISLIYDDAGYWGDDLVPVNIGKYTPEYDAQTVVMVNPRSETQPKEQHKTIELRKETKGKWGYCNSAGVLVIPAEFTNTTFFNEGMAGVEIDGKWGFINTKGKIVIQPKYDKIGYFSQGLAVVASNESYGYINLKGEEVIKLQYVYAEAFEKGYAIVREKYDYEGDGYKLTSIGRLINLKGEVVGDVKYDINKDYLNGLVSFTLPDKPYLFGLINISTGQIVAPQIYREISDFNSGLAKVMIYTQDKDLEIYPNYGFIDINGKQLVKPGLAKAEDFNSGLTVVAKFDNKDDGMLDHALMNTKGEFVLGYKWKRLIILDHNHILATVTSDENPDELETILINAQGKQIQSLVDKEVASLGHGLFVITNSDYEPITLVGLNKQFKFDSAQNKNRKLLSYQFGLIRFQNAIGNYDELLKSELEQTKIKMGLLDLNGQVIIEPKYDVISNFELTAPTRLLPN